MTGLCSRKRLTRFTPRARRPRCFITIRSVAWECRPSCLILRNKRSTNEPNSAKTQVGKTRSRLSCLGRKGEFILNWCRKISAGLFPCIHGQRVTLKDHRNVGDADERENLLEVAAGHP